MNESKVMICVPTAEFARQAVFYDYFNMMDKPVDSLMTFVHGQSPARNRNLAIEQAQQHSCTHILFIDDDLQIPPNLLTKLLSHDKDIVSGYYIMRDYPHKPILFETALDNGQCVHKFPKDGENNLVECVAFGLGAVLIKMHVFDKLERPYVRLGEIEVDHWCDDIGLWNRCREAGFKLYCDLSVTLGHMCTVTVVPEYINDKWMVSYITNSNDGKVSFPAFRPEDMNKEKKEEALV